jgi:methyltransferase
MPGSWAISAGTALVVFGFMIIAALRAGRNERAQRARGGVEPPDDVYQLMQIVYPGAFLAMLAEGAARGNAPPGILLGGAMVFAAAKALKWWAILSLGPFWTFRVIVVPGAALVSRGPYRWLRHPNYVGVLGELAGVAAIAGAPLSGVIATAVFAALIVKRIAVEERAIRVFGQAAPGGHPTSK